MIPQATPLFAVFEGSAYIELVIGWDPGPSFEKYGNAVPVTVPLGQVLYSADRATESPFRLFTSEEAATTWLLSQ